MIHQETPPQEFWERQRSVLERLRVLAPGLEEILTGATWQRFGSAAAKGEILKLKM